MLSNSKVLFDELATTLYRVGFYVSYEDTVGGEKARSAEARALCVIVQILQQQNSEGSFLHELGKLAEGKFDGIENLKNLSEGHVKNIQADLASVPQEVGLVMDKVIANFSKSEARLYADMLIAVGASVAQAYDEKDDFFLSGDKFADFVTFIANAKPLYYRILMFFSRIHADKNAKYLYDSGDLFDEMKISQKEVDVLGDVAGAVKVSWAFKYPEDLKKSVEDYIRESDGNS